MIQRAYHEHDAKDELFDGFHNLDIYSELRVNYELIKHDLVYLLKKIKQQGKKVMGYGASAKGISLLNYCGIDTDLIQSIVDETPEKQGRFTGGTQIPIVCFDSFLIEKPDYILILPWNFKAEMIEKTEHLHANYIIPIPKVRVIWRRVSLVG